MDENINSLRKRYNYLNEYQKTNYDRINLCLPKGTKARIDEEARKAGTSTSAWINGLIIGKLAAHPETTEPGTLEAEQNEK